MKTVESGLNFAGVEEVSWQCLELGGSLDVQAKSTDQAFAARLGSFTFLLFAHSMG